MHAHPASLLHLLTRRCSNTAETEAATANRAATDNKLATPTSKSAAVTEAEAAETRMLNSKHPTHTHSNNKHQTPMLNREVVVARHQEITVSGDGYSHRHIF